MSRYLLQRAGFMILVIWVVATTLFFFIHLLPGDPAEVILGSSEDFHPTEEQLEAVRRELGLDRPLYEQYFSYLFGLLRGDLGKSFLNGRPVIMDISLRFVRTLQLVLPSIFLSSILGVAIGVLAAQLRGRLSDAILSAFGLVGHSVPHFVIGALLVLVMAIYWRVLPSSGFVEFSEDPIRALKYMTLPVVTLAFGRLASTMRMTRMAMVEQFTLDYVRTARAKGLSERVVTYRHVLKNALLPVVTVIGLQLGGAFAGAMIIESIFNWPGLNSFLLIAIGNRDYPVIQGVVLVSSTIFVSINFLTDLTYAWLNPRLRYD